jgi:hypothetical protein
MNNPYYSWLPASVSSICSITWRVSSSLWKLCECNYLYRIFCYLVFAGTFDGYITSSILTFNLRNRWNAKEQTVNVCNSYKSRMKINERNSQINTVQARMHSIQSWPSKSPIRHCGHNSNARVQNGHLSAHSNIWMYWFFDHAVLKPKLFLVHSPFLLLYCRAQD